MRRALRQLRDVHADQRRLRRGRGFLAFGTFWAKSAALRVKKPRRKMRCTLRERNAGEDLTATSYRIRHVSDYSSLK